MQVIEPAQLTRDFTRWLERNKADLAPYEDYHALEIEDEVVDGRPFQQILWSEGWTRWGWPEICGGYGGGAELRAIVYDVLSSCGYVLPEGFQATEVLGTTTLTYAPELAHAHLGSYLRGDELWCQGFSEPDAGSDLASLRTKAVRDGSSFRISGQKTWSSLASVADRCYLLARSDPESGAAHGLSMLLVDLDAPGVTVRAIRAANGRNEFGEIFFDDVVVSADRCIGMPGQGWEIAMHLLQWERGMYAWQRQAYLHRRLDNLVADLGPTRVHQEADRLGEAYVQLSALRSMCARTVRDLAVGHNPGPGISLVKLVLSATEQNVFDAIIELTAPSLIFDPDPRASILRAEYFYTRATSVYGGAAEIQRNIVAERLLGLPRENRHG
jgi:alkylation response protein AidB-like acyl-CoA dehydrogenase